MVLKPCRGARVSPPSSVCVEAECMCRCVDNVRHSSSRLHSVTSPFVALAWLYFAFNLCAFVWNYHCSMTVIYSAECCTVWLWNSDVLHPLTPPPVLAPHPQLSVLHDQILRKSWEIRQEICSFDSHANFLICWHQMSDFKATVHQIQFRDPTGGAYSAPPDPVAGFKGPISQGTKGVENGRGRGWEGEKGMAFPSLVYTPYSKCWKIPYCEMLFCPIRQQFLKMFHRVIRGTDTWVCVACSFGYITIAKDNDWKTKTTQINDWWRLFAYHVATLCDCNTW